MTPTDILASARSKPLSAVVPARDEWLDGYEGPLRYAGEHGPIAAWRIGGGDDHHHVVFIRGLSVDAVTCGPERLRFDLRRREVRHRLVDCGAPEWCRESVAGMLGWVLLGAAFNDVLSAWVIEEDGRPRRRNIGVAPVRWRIGTVMRPGGDMPQWVLWDNADGPATMLANGPETGPEGRSCADLAALRAGCVLEEADGWYIPLPDDGVGWLPREAA